MKTTARALILLMYLAPNAWCAEPDALRAYSLRCAEYYANRYQVPIELVEAMIEVESNWQPYVVSPKGAAGLMQLMPATAAHFGVRNRFHIEENIRAGVEYLAGLIRDFHGDLRLAVAAYYTGERPILARGLDYCSPDVYSYVARVSRLYRAKRLAKTPRVLSERPPEYHSEVIHDDR
ncbi:MAG: lytic transglycosylase domain-containing protein [Terriglobia bacterium]